MKRKEIAVVLPLLCLFFLPLSGCGLPGGDIAGNEYVQVIQNVPYIYGGGWRNQLDLYLPRHQEGFPVLVFVHGGAWITGDKSDFADFALTIAEGGVAVATVNYRLFPAVKYPTYIRDVARAFQWVVENIADYAGDPNAVFVGGHSAGAHLAALLATNEEYLQEVGLDQGYITGVVPISGVYLIVDDNGGVFGDSDAAQQDASPSDNTDAGTPPFLLLLGDHDLPGLDDQAENMLDALKGAGVPCQLRIIANRNHASIIDAVNSTSDPVAQLIFTFVAAL